MEALPKTVDYSEPLGVLPSGTENYNVTCYSISGSTFTAGQQIIVDLNNVGYLDPASLSIRYKLTAVIPSGAAAASVKSYSIPGCVYSTPILRTDVLFNSNVVESINNYNAVATAISNLQMSISDKMGISAAMGYYEAGVTVDATGNTTSTTDFSTINENTDGLTIVVTASALTTNTTTVVFTVSGPLYCCLSNAEKLIPMNGTNIRLAFTLDTLASVCPSAITTINNGVAGAGTATTAGQFQSYSISNFEVVYNQIQFPPQIERQILSLPKIRIKTSSYATALQTLPSGSSGTANLIYNLRYASIKSLLLILGSSSAKSNSKLFESIDLTNSGGSYGFNINGINYPQNALSAQNNKASLLIELRRAMQNIYTGNVSMSINNNEFSQTDTTVNALTNGSAINIPSKFYVGVNTRKMDTSALFTGVSSQNSPITAVINIGSTATALAYTPILTLFYDSIIEIDTLTKQVNYIY